ncbi:MAG: protein kinase [Kofleriaceae bacterium]
MAAAICRFMDHSSEDDLLILALNAAYRVFDKTSHRLHVKLGTHGTMSALSSACYSEARQHPGIAQVVGCGIVAGRRWTATVIAEGQTVFDAIARATLSSQEVLKLIYDVAIVLAHAHERGAIHRSLTTRNITFRLAAPGYPVSVSGWTDTLIDIGASARTVFTAPEIGYSRSLDGRVDVYALGVIAYRAVTGTMPRGGDDVVEGAPAPIAALILAMLQRDPNRRPTSNMVRERAASLLKLSQASQDATEPQPFARGSRVMRQPNTQRLSPPRFSAPKWTPPNGPGATDIVSGEIDTAELLPFCDEAHD